MVGFLPRSTPYTSVYAMVGSLEANEMTAILDKIAAGELLARRQSRERSVRGRDGDALRTWRQP